MILDELDSGVGARLGRAVGHLLRNMAAAQLQLHAQLNTQQHSTQLRNNQHLSTLPADNIHGPQGTGCELINQDEPVNQRMPGPQYQLKTHQLKTHQLNSQPEVMTQRQVGAASQILCVSHLPQVCSCFSI